MGGHRSPTDPAFFIRQSLYQQNVIEVMVVLQPRDAQIDRLGEKTVS